MQCRPSTEKWVSYKKPKVYVEFLFHQSLQNSMLGRGSMRNTSSLWQVMRGVKRGTEGLDLDCSIFSNHPISQMLFKVLTRNEVKKEWTTPYY